MNVTVDRFGRVVIPKPLRDRLGLDAGSVLEIEQREEAVLLRPSKVEPDLVEEDGVVVFTGEAEGNLGAAVDAHRDARLGRLAAWKSG